MKKRYSQNFQQTTQRELFFLFHNTQNKSLPRFTYLLEKCITVSREPTHTH